MALDPTPPCQAHCPVASSRAGRGETVFAQFAEIDRLQPASFAYPTSVHALPFQWRLEFELGCAPQVRLANLGSHAAGHASPLTVRIGPWTSPALDGSQR